MLLCRKVPKAYKHECAVKHNEDALEKPLREMKGNSH